MEHVTKFQKQLNEFLNQKNAFTDLLKKVEGKTGVASIKIVYGILAYICVHLIVGYGSQFLCNFIGFLYPAYASLKAIESKGSDDDTKWLTYWVVYAAFSIIEVFADIVLFWIPLYSFIKCVFLLYLMAPIPQNGSIMLYSKVIRPYVLKYQEQIDTAIKRGQDLAGEMGKKAADEYMKNQ